MLVFLLPYMVIKIQTILYIRTRLYNSKATKPPKICEIQYGTISVDGSFPAAAMVILTTGLICPPEILEVSKMTSAKAAPMANGFPVAKMT